MYARPLTFVATILAITASTHSLAQLVPRPPLLPVPSVRMPVTPFPIVVFENVSQFFTHVAKARGLPRPESPETAGQVEARSTFDRLQEPSGDVIVVVRVEEGAADGSDTFYVMRDSPRGLTLLGEMKGRGYQWTADSGHLEFTLDATGRASSDTPPRYQVDGDFLVDLATLTDLDPDAPIPPPDWKHAF